MNALKSILHEIYGLFVDDGFLALAILLWLAALRLLLPYLPPQAQLYAAPILFSGLALILLASTLRYARRPGTKSNIPPVRKTL